MIGLGAPREMVWCQRHRDELPTGLVLTCGGWFGHIVGDERRAPRMLRRSGLEWIARVAQAPKRLGPRYARGAGATALLALARSARLPPGPDRRLALVSVQRAADLVHHCPREDRDAPHDDQSTHFPRDWRDRRGIAVALLGPEAPPLGRGAPPRARRPAVPPRRPAEVRSPVLSDERAPEPCGCSATAADYNNRGIPAVRDAPRCGVRREQQPDLLGAVDGPPPRGAPHLLRRRRGRRRRSALRASTCATSAFPGSASSCPTPGRRWRAGRGRRLGP